jgi:DNA-binding MarR family transcriptional regulator
MIYRVMSQDNDPDLLSLMQDVARLLRIEADRRARIHGLTRAQWALLIRLERSPGLSQKEIADLLEVEPISVARLVDRLEACKLVERRADADDRRIWRLHLQPAADAALAEIHIQRAALAAQTIEGIAAPARQAVSSALLQMKANLSRPAGAEPVKETA